MFSIMENRKRPRLEMINVNGNISNEIIQGVASATTSLGTATLATIDGQSFIFNSSSSTAIPTNILLSICDEITDPESEEFILDHSLITPVKQEHTINNKTNLVNAAPQYRIINQAGKVLSNTSLNKSVINNTTVNAKNNVLPNGLNFPPGCEIYVVKEVFDTPDQVIPEATTTINTNPKILSGNGATIKLGNISTLPAHRQTIVNGTQRQNLNSNPIVAINNTSPVSSTSISSSNLIDYSAKRRAIHNEVERRRRDKINSLIFNLKELLPSEVTASNSNNSSSPTSLNQNNTSNLLLAQQQGSATTTRMPSNDSKSQILIKACEYIKSMQEEISSLRECLTENENLRLKNERLQDEINTLRAKQQKLRNNCNILLTTNSTSTHNNSNNNSDNSDCEITLNSLNSTYADVQLFSPSTNHHNNHHLTDLVGLTNSHATSTPTPVNVKYAKRKLIITDYVD